MASHSQGSKSAPPISSNFSSARWLRGPDGAGAPALSFAAALGTAAETTSQTTSARQQQQQKRQPQQASTRGAADPSVFCEYL